MVAITSNPVSKEHKFLKMHFLSVNIKSMHKPSPLKQVLFFIKLNKFLLFINETILGLGGSKIKFPSMTLWSFSCEKKPIRSSSMSRKYQLLCDGGL